MAAKKLGISMEQVKDFFLTYNECEDNYETKHKPCDFLMEDGKCKLEEVRPDNCKEYPYTDRPERLYSLFAVLHTITVCPVAFEIYEQLKKEYGFRKNLLYQD